MAQKIPHYTLVAAVLLAPIAWWQEDVLIVGLAGLIPFFAERFSRKIETH